MDFKTYYLGLDPKARESFAERVGTTIAYCHQLAYGTKRIELGLADAIVAASVQKITLAELPLTEKAKFQSKAREWDGKSERRAKCRNKPSSTPSPAGA